MFEVFEAEGFRRHELYPRAPPNSMCSAPRHKAKNGESPIFPRLADCVLELSQLAEMKGLRGSENLQKSFRCPLLSARGLLLNMGAKPVAPVKIESGGWP